VLKGKGHVKDRCVLEQEPDTGKGEAAAASKGLTGKGEAAVDSVRVAGTAMGKVDLTSDRGSGKLQGKAKAVVTPVEDEDRHDDVIVEVFPANPMAKQVNAKAEQVNAQAEPASSVPIRMASAAAKDGVLGHRCAEHERSWEGSAAPFV